MREYVLEEARQKSSSLVLGLLRALVAIWRRRRMLQLLYQMDDRLLHDVGLTRDELTAIDRLPMGHDLTEELQRRRETKLRLGIRHR